MEKLIRTRYKAPHGVGGPVPLTRCVCEFFRGSCAVMAQESERESFFPSGAIASFLVMIVFYVGLWFGLYLLMAYRG